MFFEQSLQSLNHHHPLALIPYIGYDRTKECPEIHLYLYILFASLLVSLHNLARKICVQLQTKNNKVSHEPEE